MNNNEVQNLFISTKTKIKTRHKNTFDWVTSIILNTYKNYIEILLSEEYLKTIVLIGDIIFCEICDVGNIYTIEAEVINVKLISKTIVLRINNINKIKNFREFQRYYVSISSSISTEDSIGEKYAVIINLSESGLGMITNCNLDINNIVFLKLYFRSFQTTCNILCNIIWKRTFENNFLYGVKIFDIDNINTIIYEELINYLSTMEKNIVQKLLDDSSQKFSISSNINTSPVKEIFFEKVEGIVEEFIEEIE